MQLRVPILSMISTLNRISTLNTKGLVSKNVLPDKLYQLGEVEHDHRNGITFTINYHHLSGFVRADSSHTLVANTFE